MKLTAQLRRSLWLFWVLALAIFVWLIFFPLSTEKTRFGSIVIFALLWFGLIGLCWQMRMARGALLAITVSAGVFVFFPATKRSHAADLRHDYARALLRYENVRYVWGGESFKGIDCSGLVRRGLIDAAFLRGVRTCDPALIREAFFIWWHDETAKMLSEDYLKMTRKIFSAPSINMISDAQLQSGDLAVTASGVHVLAYLDDHIWIEADPLANKVIRVSVPDERNVWLQTPVNIVRWRLMDDESYASVEISR